MIQKGHSLQFNCQECETPVGISLIALEESVKCTECGKKYRFQDETLVRQIKKFEKLCKTLVDSEEILSETAVGINIGDKQIEVPYRLLLTRLNSTLSLKLDGKPLKIQFRLEPGKDLRFEF